MWSDCAVLCSPSFDNDSCFDYSVKDLSVEKFVSEFAVEINPFCSMIVCEIAYAPSFLRILKKLDPYLTEKVKATADKVINLYVMGQKTEDLGITRLRGTLWEARADIRVRVIYDLAKNRLTFVVAGTHNDVRNFLKR